MCDAEWPDAAARPNSTSATTSKPTSNASSAVNTPFDPAYYTWSLFFRGILGTASDSEVKKYLHNRSLVEEESDCNQCDQWRDWLFQYSPTVTYLKSSIEKLGGTVSKENVVCRRCDTLSPTGIKQGAFVPDRGVLLCANHVRDRSTMEDVLSHELVHAYDYQRFRFDRFNLRHAACTEIRANLLSGECRWTREFFGRYQFKFTQHFQECVRRRAVLAVRAKAACKDDTHASKVVDEVWDSCFADTRPFDEIYR